MRNCRAVMGPVTPGKAWTSAGPDPLRVEALLLADLVGLVEARAGGLAHASPRPLAYPARMRLATLEMCTSSAPS